MFVFSLWQSFAFAWIRAFLYLEVCGRKSAFVFRICLCKRFAFHLKGVEITRHYFVVIGCSCAGWKHCSVLHVICGASVQNIFCCCGHFRSFFPIDDISVYIFSKVTHLVTTRNWHQYLHPPLLWPGSVYLALSSLSGFCWFGLDPSKF